MIKNIFLFLKKNDQKTVNGICKKGMEHFECFVFLSHRIMNFDLRMNNIAVPIKHHLLL